MSQNLLALTPPPHPPPPVRRSLDKTEIKRNGLFLSWCCRRSDQKKRSVIASSKSDHIGVVTSLHCFTLIKTATFSNSKHSCRERKQDRALLVLLQLFLPLLNLKAQQKWLRREHYSKTRGYVTKKFCFNFSQSERLSNLLRESGIRGMHFHIQYGGRKEVWWGLH